jgi:hypothetical protein
MLDGRRQVNVRFNEDEFDVLKALADDRYSGSVSEAVRQAVRDAALLQRAREEYYKLAIAGLRIPRYIDGRITSVERILAPYAPEIDEDFQP